MFNRTKVYLLGFIFFTSQYALAQIDGRLKSKLIDLLYILVPLVFIVSAFLILEWKRKKDVQAETVIRLSDKKKK